MKNLLITFFTLLFCITSSVGYSQNIVCEKTGYTCPEIDSQELVVQDGLYYKKFTDIPFTGKSKGKENGSLKFGLREGSWVTYDNNGKISFKGDYHNGIKIGTWIEEGVWTSVYKDGKLFTKVKYKNGKKDGPWREYYSNGNVKLKGNYKNGKKHSLWLGFHYNGTLISTGEYLNGMKEGSWTEFDSYGKKTYKGNFRNGLMEGYNIFFIDRSMTGTYKYGNKIGD